MPTVSLRKRFDASPEKTFAVCADFPNTPRTCSEIIKVELLTPGPVGVGTRFRETRVMFKREATEVMEVVKFDPPRFYELVARSCGCEYHTTFRFTPDGTGTVVNVEFAAIPRSFFARLLSPLAGLMRGMIEKCLEKDLEDARKAAEAPGDAVLA